MPIDSGDPAVAAADLNALLDALAADLQPTDPVPAPEQDRFAAFFHS
jgi:hypothetical protein